MEEEANIGLVLTGGGARSAYQAGCILAITEIATSMGIKRPFPVITGMSAGSINASYMAGRADKPLQGAKDLVKMWNNVTSDQVFETSLANVLKNTLALGASLITGRSSATQSRALLNTAPLRRLIESHFDLRALAHQLEQGHLDSLAISCVSYNDGYSHTFYQTLKKVQPWIRARRHAQPCTITPDHVMASSAIPLLFPPTEIDAHWFGDGSLRNYAPLTPAIKMGADRLIVVGVRRPTGGMEPEILLRPPGVGRVFSLLLNSLFLDAIDLDYERLRRINLTLKSVQNPNEFHLKNIDICLLMPSEDVGEIACQ